jgi:hypothetical protein
MCTEDTPYTLVKGFCEYGNELSGTIKEGGFFD